MPRSDLDSAPFTTSIVAWRGWLYFVMVVRSEFKQYHSNTHIPMAPMVPLLSSYCLYIRRQHHSYVFGPFLDDVLSPTHSSSSKYIKSPSRNSTKYLNPTHSRLPLTPPPVIRRKIKHNRQTLLAVISPTTPLNIPYSLLLDLPNLTPNFTSQTLKVHASRSLY